MNNSQAFKKAHAMTKAIIANGDSYSVTFGACLKAIKAEALNQAQAIEQAKTVSSKRLKLETSFAIDDAFLFSLITAVTAIVTCMSVFSGTIIAAMFKAVSIDSGVMFLESSLIGTAAMLAFIAFAWVVSVIAKAANHIIPV
ncbi:hypothetical protein D3C85_691620 [compost metagenome]